MLPLRVRVCVQACMFVFVCSIVLCVHMPPQLPPLSPTPPLAPQVSKLQPALDPEAVFPDSLTVYDWCYDQESSAWVQWMATIPEFRCDPGGCQGGGLGRLG